MLKQAYLEEGKLCCPHCNWEDIPRNELETCSVCGNEYRVPWEYLNRRGKLYEQPTYDQYEESKMSAHQK